MKTLFTLLLTFFIATSFGQATKTADSAKKIQKIEVSCGQCKLGLPGKGCDLAARVEGKAYFVDGVDIDSLGDAHAKDGFCNAIRKAEAQGEIIDNRFKITWIKLLPFEIKANSGN